jgi:tRNA G18 (ribose-2'-O)-methylase SpoU
VVALTPDLRAEPIAQVSRRLSGGSIALALGGEDAGLNPAALAAADVSCRIPMAPGVDSINVGIAAGIALHRFAELAELAGGEPLA